MKQTYTLSDERLEQMISVAVAHPQEVSKSNVIGLRFGKAQTGWFAGSAVAACLLLAVAVWNPTLPVDGADESEESALIYDVMMLEMLEEFEA